MSPGYRSCPKHWFTVDHEVKKKAITGSLSKLVMMIFPPFSKVLAGRRAPMHVVYSMSNEFKMDGNRDFPTHFSMVKIPNHPIETIIYKYMAIRFQAIIVSQNQLNLQYNICIIFKPLSSGDIFLSQLPPTPTEGEQMTYRQNAKTWYC